MQNTNLAPAYEARNPLNYYPGSNPADDCSENDDESMVRRIRNGDRKAEQLLASRFLPRIRLLGRKLGAEAHLCEDLAQEAILKVILNLRSDRLKEVSKLSAYVDQTARFTYFGWRRNRNNQLELRESCDEVQNSSNVEEAYIHACNRLWVIEQIEKLSMQRDQLLLLKFYINEQDKSEICRTLDLSHDQFDKALYRARMRLKKICHA